MLRVKSQSALVPLLLLSEPKPLRWLRFGFCWGAMNVMVIA